MRRSWYGNGRWEESLRVEPKIRDLVWEGSVLLGSYVLEKTSLKLLPICQDDEVLALGSLIYRVLEGTVETEAVSAVSLLYSDDGSEFSNAIYRELVKQGFPSSEIERRKELVQAYIRAFQNKKVSSEHVTSVPVPWIAPPAHSREPTANLESISSGESSDHITTSSHSQLANISLTGPGPVLLTSYLGSLSLSNTRMEMEEEKEKFEMRMRETEAKQLDEQLAKLLKEADENLRKRVEVRRIL